MTHQDLGDVLDAGWWENPGPGRPEENLAQCLRDDLEFLQAAEGSTESSPLPFGAEKALWPRASEKDGKWYRVVVLWVESFMTRWHRVEALRSRLRHSAENANNGDNGGEEDGGGKP